MKSGIPLSGLVTENIAAIRATAPVRMDTEDWTKEPSGSCPRKKGAVGIAERKTTPRGLARGNAIVFLANSEFAVISIHASRTNCRNPSIFRFSNAATKLKPGYSRARVKIDSLTR
jgi:hypothetical protein